MTQYVLNSLLLFEQSGTLSTLAVNPRYVKPGKHWSDVVGVAGMMS